MTLESLRMRSTHGGDLSVDRRKECRPVVTRRPMHVTLRATCARGALSFLKKQNADKVRRLLSQHSRRWEVRVYESANVGNHLHLLVQARTREGFRGFLRSFAGSLAMAVTGSRKGKPFGKRFWDLLAFSRIVEWGKAFKIVKDYCLLNRLEAAGLISRKAAFHNSE